MTLSPDFKPCNLTIAKVEDSNGETYMANHNGEMIGPFVIGLKATIDAWNLEISLAELEEAIEKHNAATSSDEQFEANKLLPPILQRRHHRPHAYIRNYSASDTPILD